MRPEQVPQLWVGVNLGIMAMKEYSSDLQYMQFSATLKGLLLLCREYSQCILSPDDQAEGESWHFIMSTDSVKCFRYFLYTAMLILTFSWLIGNETNSHLWKKKKKKKMQGERKMYKN